MAEYSIPARRLDYLQQKIAKLNRRCTRLSVPLINMSILGSFTKIDEDGGRVRHYFKVEVRGEAPKINGYTFAAKLAREGDVVLFNKVPGYDKTLPDRFRGCEPQCDHCGFKRRRVDTFVLERESDGAFIQVGRNCLADFLGHMSPQAYASWAEILLEVDRACCEDDDLGGGGPRASSCRDLQHFTQVCIAIVRRYGFAPASREGISTVSRVNKAYSDLNDSEASAADRAKARELMVLAETYAEEAKTVIEWAKTVDTTRNDFLYNLSQIANVGYFVVQRSGLAAALYQAYLRAHETQRSAAPISTHVGVVSERRVFLNVEFTKSIRYSSCYGEGEVLLFRDQDGNVLKWASSSFPNITAGKTYDIKGTIKAHGEYRGTKQTELSRVTILREIPAQPAVLAVQVAEGEEV